MSATTELALLLTSLTANLCAMGVMLWMSHLLSERLRTTSPIILTGESRPEFDRINREDWKRLEECLAQVRQEVARLSARMEELVASRGQSLPPVSHPARQEPVAEQARVTKSDASQADLGAVAAEVLEELERTGTGSELAKLAGLRSWLSSKDVGLKAEPVLRDDRSNEGWLLSVIFRDGGDLGQVVPITKTIIGPRRELREWFELGLYDGTTALSQSNVRSLPKARFDQAQRRWIPEVRGEIGTSQR